MRKVAILAVMLMLAVSMAVAQNTKTEAAQKNAESWLGLVDNGDYAGSYDRASSTFKAALTKDKWVDTSKAVRSPLGKLVSRTLQNAQYTTQLPGAPDGQYVVVQYQSSFENKKVAVETVILQLEKDGQWKVSGYFIK